MIKAEVRARIIGHLYSRKTTALKIYDVFRRSAQIYFYDEIFLIKIEFHYNSIQFILFFLGNHEFLAPKRSKKVLQHFWVSNRNANITSRTRLSANRIRDELNRHPVDWDDELSTAQPTNRIRQLVRVRRPHVRLFEINRTQTGLREMGDGNKSQIIKKNKQFIWNNKIKQFKVIKKIIWNN